jgi:tetratricopeptide (TPR) repeat protein
LDLNEKATQEMLLVRRLGLAGLSKLEHLQVEAIDFTITREFDKAAEKYEEMSRSGGDDVYLDLGRVYENAGKPDKAIESYGRAAEGPGHNPAAWLALGGLYARSGKVPKAEEAFQNAEQAFRAGNSLEGLTELAFQRGTAASARDQFDAAATYLHQALETARLAGNIHQEVRTKLYLSANAYRSGDAATAEGGAREAIDLARLNRIDSLAVRGLIALGLAYTRKGDTAGAERYDQQGLTLARGAGNSRLTAYSLLALASLHNTAARYDESAREAAEALAFYEPNGFATETFQCLTLLGRARLRGAGDIKGALEYFERASTVAQKAGDRGSAALTEESLGATLAAQQRYPEAVPHFRKEMELSTTDERRGYSALKLGSNLSSLGRYAEAQDAFTLSAKAAPKFPALNAWLLQARARMELSQHHYQQARDLAVQALASPAASDRRLHSELTAPLGLALAGLGDVHGGLRRCRESLDDAIQVDEIPLLILARAALAQVLVQSGDRAAVLKLLRGHESETAKYPEANWRVLAVMAQADPQYGAPARAALQQLEQLWGSEAFRQYSARPDVEQLSRPLFQATNAKHQ